MTRRYQSSAADRNWKCEDIEDLELYILIQLYVISLACIYKQCNIDNCCILTVYMYIEISYGYSIERQLLRLLLCVGL